MILESVKIHLVVALPISLHTLRFKRDVVHPCLVSCINNFSPCFIKCLTKETETRFVLIQVVLVFICSFADVFMFGGGCSGSLMKNRGQCTSVGSSLLSSREPTQVSRLDTGTFIHRCTSKSTFGKLVWV